MLISTQTGLLDRRFGFKGTLDIIKSAGFDAYDATLFAKKYFELNDIFAEGDYLETARQIRKYADSIGLFCNQAHAPFGSKQGACEKDSPMFDKIVRAMVIASTLGAKAIVVHPLHHLKYAQNAIELKQENIRFYLDLLPYAKRLGIVILAENMWQWDDNKDNIVPSVCSDPSEFAQYVDMINSPYFKACLDIGHVALLGGSIYDTIKTLGTRLEGLHIHDNDLSYDTHQIPFTGKVNFSEMTTALAEIGYKGDITFEANEFFSSIPDEQVPIIASLLAKTGKFFKDKII